MRRKQNNVLKNPRAIIGGYGTPENPIQVRVHMDSELDPSRTHLLSMTMEEAQALVDSLSNLLRMEVKRG